MDNPSPDGSATNPLWNILIIDDDEDDFFLVREMLKAARGRKFNVHWADSYAAGHAALASNLYDAVLVDYDLGVHSGIELIREATGQGCAAPLILFTGRGSYDIDVEAMQAGATLYLTKGETSALMLERAIRYAIERKQAEQALARSSRRISEILSSIADDFYVLDRRWVFVYANPQFTRKIGKEPEDFIGNCIWEMFPKHIGSTLYENFHASMEKGEIRRFEVGGQYTSAWYSMTSFPTAEGITVLGTDITGRKRAEQEISHLLASVEQERARLQSVINNIPDEVWFVDETGRLVLVNEQVIKAFGSEILGGQAASRIAARSEVYRPDGTVRPPEEAPPLRALQGEHVRGQVEIVRTPLTGELRFRQVNAAPVKDEQGRLLGSVSIVRDITDHRQAEETLRSNEQRFRSILEGSRDVLYRVNLQTGRYEFISPSCEQVVGYTAAELMAQDARTALEMIHPEDREAMRSALDCLQTEDATEVVYRQRTRAGDYRWMSNRLSVVRDENGSLLYRDGNIRDITEHIQADHRLRESEARISEVTQHAEDRYRMLFKGMEEGFGVWELVRDEAGQAVDLHLLEGNPAWEKQTGIPVERAIGRNALELFPSADPRWLPMYAQVVDQQQPAHFEQYFKGTDRWYAVTVYPMQGQQVAVFFNDITRHKRTEETLQAYSRRLEQSNQELEQFAFAASHDLQEPLRKIKLLGNTLQEQLQGRLDEVDRDSLQRMLGATARMQAMIDDLLLLSRVSTEGQPFVTVDLSEVAAEVVSDLELLIRRTGGQVTVEALPLVQADPIQIHLVLQNLIGNALKFHKPGTPPVVRVSGSVGQSADGGEAVTIRVADNGIGFDEGQFERMLQPFQRLHGRSEYAGTGMGLAIVKKIVERHKGEISACSAPGEGACFVVRLPGSGQRTAR